MKREPEHTKPQYFWIKARTQQHLQYGLPDDHDYVGISCPTGTIAADSLLKSANYHERLATELLSTTKALRLACAELNRIQADFADIDRPTYKQVVTGIREAERLLAEIGEEK